MEFKNLLYNVLKLNYFLKYLSRAKLCSNNGDKTLLILNSNNMKKLILTILVSAFVAAPAFAKAPTPVKTTSFQRYVAGGTAASSTDGSLLGAGNSATATSNQVAPTAGATNTFVTSSNTAQGQTKGTGSAGATAASAGGFVSSTIASSSTPVGGH